MAKTTTVINEDVKYNRTGYLILDDDNVIFDCSDGEYGPVEFPITLLLEKLKKHLEKNE